MIAEKIRKQIDRVDGVNGEMLSPLAVEYCSEVAKVNARLEEAMRLLRQGLRSEAIQLANARPNVIEAASQLDFAEVGDFVEICQFLGIVVPEKVNRDAVEQLQQAMVEEQPLETLLREHRRLAIAKAPLAWRLRVLRQISRRDKTNAVWLEDIEQWERARTKELVDEVRNALKQQNLASAQQLNEEVNQTKWRIKVPEAIKSEASAAYEGLLRESQVADLQLVVESMNAAFAEMDEMKGRMARGKWQRLEEELKDSLPQDLRELAEPALLWLDQRDEDASTELAHRNACSALEMKLQSDSKLVDLQNAYHSVMKWNLGIDPTLEDQYRSAVDRMETQAARKNRLILASLAAAAVVMVCSVGLLLWNRAKNQERRVAIEELSTFVEEEKLQDASAFLERLRSEKPHLVGVAEIASLISQLEGKLSEEESRVGALMDLTGKVDLQDPNLIDAQLLLKAEQLAKTDEEKSKLLQIRRRRDKYDGEVQAAQLKTVRERLREIEDRLAVFEKNTDLVQGDSMLGEVQRELDGIKTEYPKAGQKALDLVAITEKKVDSLRTSLRELVLKKATEQRLITNVRAADSVQKLAQSLEAYNAEKLSSPISVEFSQVASEKDLWSTLLGWNSVADKIKEVAVDGILPSEVENVLSKYEPMREILGSHPAIADSPKWREELEMIPKRTDLLEFLISDLSDDVMSDLRTVIGIGKPAAGGAPTQVRQFIHEEFYQAKKDSINDTKSFGLEVVADTGGAVRNFGMTAPVVVHDEPRSTLRQLTSTLGKNKTAILSDWDLQLLQAIGNVYKNPNLDSQLKEILITRILETAIGGSGLLKAELGGIFDLLESRTEEQKLWYEAVPFESKLNEAIDTTVRTALSGALAKVKSRKDQFLRLGARRYSMIGMLDRDADNKVFVRVLSTPPDVEFYVVASNPDLPNAIRVIRAGKVTNREPVLELSDEQAIAGRPVFALMTAE